MNSTIRKNTAIKPLIQVQNLATQGQSGAFLQCIEKIARKASSEAQRRQDVTAVNSFKSINEYSFNPNENRYLNLRNLDQSSVDETKKNNDKLKEEKEDDEVKSNEYLLNFFPSQINSISLPADHIEISKNIEMPSHPSRIEWINYLVKQIDLHAPHEASTPTLKITLNQEVLPETEVTLQHTDAGWAINFKTCSSISYLQINQHLENLKQRFRDRRIGLISVNITMQNSL